MCINLTGLSMAFQLHKKIIQLRSNPIIPYLYSWKEPVQKCVAAYHSKNMLLLDWRGEKKVRFYLKRKLFKGELSIENSRIFLSISLKRAISCLSFPKATEWNWCLRYNLMWVLAVVVAVSNWLFHPPIKTMGFYFSTMHLLGSWCHW